MSSITARPGARSGIAARLDGWLGRPSPTPVRGAPMGVQRERHAPAWPILVSALALAAVGILMVYSSTGVRSYIARDDTFASVGPQLLWAMLGVIAMLVVSRVDYRYWRLASIPLLAGTIVLLVLVLLPAIGPFRPVVVGGSARWLRLGPLPAIHPAELAKLALVVYLAHWMARRGSTISSVRRGTLPFLLIAGLVIFLVIREPDLGTTTVITLTAFTMFVVAGANLWQFALLLPAGVMALAYVITNHSYQLERVTTWLDPWKDPQGTGFQTVQGLLALAVGGVTGTGLGASRQPGGLALPNAHNDFIFAVVGQELGFAGALGVILLFALLAYHGVRVALTAPDTFGGLLATGITAWLTLQAFLNIAVVVSLIPITGITLPFVSDGGSSLLVSFAAVGILLSISRETQPRGTFNDAHPDRGGRHGRTHLPRTGGRPLPASPARGR